jgi:3-hydroxyacyl-[acyl-carrier-protein] dehydratase
VAELLSKEAVLASIPHQKPFRFIDEIVEITNDHIIGRYRFREDEYFYEGHFPNNPITPGVILIETLGQIGVVALGIYLVHQVDDNALNDMTTVLTETSVEFSGVVRPGDEVTVTARKIYFRRMKLKVEAEMTRADGTRVCSGEIAGMGVRLR